jgi:hypothetical protein
MLLIEDEEEAYEEVGMLVLPKQLEEVIVIFLGEKSVNKIVTSVLESNRDRLIRI